MPGNAVVRIPCVPVIHLAAQRILAPAVPGRGIAVVVVTECGIVDHLPLVWITMRCRGNIAEAAVWRAEAGTAKAEWAIEFTVNEHVEWLTADPLDNVAQQHEA